MKNINSKIKKLNKLLYEFSEYVSAFCFLPPQGEYAKAEAIKEFNNVSDRTLQMITNIRNDIISQLKEGD